MAPVLVMSLYHCTLPKVVFNTQVNTVPLPSHVVTSSGGLITSRNENVVNYTQQKLDRKPKCIEDIIVTFA